MLQPYKSFVMVFARRSRKNHAKPCGHGFASHANVIRARATALAIMYIISQFQKLTTFEIGFAFTPVSLKSYANAAIKGSSFKNRPIF